MGDSNGKTVTTFYVDRFHIDGRPEADAVIIVAAATPAAYDLDTGTPRWSGPKGGEGYSSPHRSTIDGVAQILLMGADGVNSFAPADGALLWDYAWSGTGIVQPALVDGDILIGS